MSPDVDPERPRPGAPARHRRAAAGAAALLLAGHAALAFDSLRRKSVTYDEVSHLPAGLALAATGEMRLNPQHPPLVKLLAGLAASTAGARLPLGGAAWRDGDEWAFGKEVLFAGGNDDRALLLRGRLPTVLLSLAGGLVVWWWSRRLWGEAGGLLSLGLWALSPTVLAHARLVTMDVPLAALSTLTLYLWWRATRGEPRAVLLVACGAALGAALLTKFSALVLLPAMAACELLATGARAGWRRRLLSWAVVAGVAVGLVQGVYLTAGGLAGYARGLRSLYADLPADYAFYLAGRFRQGGFPHYFLVAWAVKSTLAELAASGGGAVGAALDRRRWHDDLYLWLPAALWLAATSALASNQGVRYLLPLHPLLFVLAGRLAPMLARRRAWAGPALAGLLLAAQGGEALAQHPDYIPYFNPLAGGTAAGPRWLDDSNLDWSEDLGRLPGWLRERGVDRVRLAWFGPIDPDHYGVPREPFLGPDWRSKPRPGAYVISAHVLVRGLLSARGQGWKSDWLERYRPAAVLGGSLYLYVFPDDPDAASEVGAGQEGVPSAGEEPAAGDEVAAEAGPVR